MNQAKNPEWQAGWVDIAVEQCEQLLDHVHKNTMSIFAILSMIHQEPLQLSELSSQKSMLVKGSDLILLGTAHCSPPLHLSQLYWENSPKINLMEFYPKIASYLAKWSRSGQFVGAAKGEVEGGLEGGDVINLFQLSSTPSLSLAWKAAALINSIINPLLPHDIYLFGTILSYECENIWKNLCMFVTSLTFIRGTAHCRESCTAFIQVVHLCLR